MNTRLKATLLLSMFLFVPSLFAHKIPIDTSCFPITDDSPYIHYFQLHVHEPPPTPPATRSPRRPTPTPRRPTPPPPTIKSPRTIKSPPPTIKPPPAIKPPPIIKKSPPPTIKLSPPLVMTYEHTFPKGVSLQHIPLDIIDFNESGIAVNSVPGVFDQLDDSVASLIASRGSSGWTYVTYSDSPAHNAIWKSIGFVAVMHEEVMAQIKGRFGGWTGESASVYHEIHLRSGGLTLLGVPVKSQSLMTVSDFFTYFRNVESVKGINPDLDIEVLDRPFRITDDWFVELDGDTEINGYTAYLIASDGAEVRALWGLPWVYENSPQAAPGIMPMSRTLITTWGRVKHGLVNFR